MSKLMKFIGRFFAILVDLALICIIIFAFVIRTSPVQTYLAKKATTFLSKELNTKLHIEKVAFVFIDRLALEGVYIEDDKGNVLADIKTLHLKFDEVDLAQNKFSIASAELEEGDVHILRDSLTGNFNYGFIVDYFDSGEPKTKKKPIALNLEKLKLSDVNFKYDDNRKAHKDFGMDWSHLDFSNVNLTAGNIEVRGSDIICNIENLSTKEKSGFVLDNLTTHAKVTTEGIYLSELSIKTPLSDVKMDKMNLVMNHLSDMRTFEDSVSFDANILPSKVSLADVAYFAPPLKGMDQMVNISGAVTRKTKNLRVSNLNLRTGDKTIVKGTVNLPDFKNIDGSFFSEKIDYAYVDINDLKNIRLPEKNGGGYMSFDKYVGRLGHFEGTDVKLDGFTNEFVIAANKVSSDLGDIRMENGIRFTKNYQNNSYEFKKSLAGDYDVKVENFQLGQFLDDKTFGNVDGTFSLEGEAFSTNDIRFDLIAGNVNHFDFMDYGYSNIEIKEGSIKDNILTATVDVKDDNLDLIYDGSINLNGEQHMDFNVQLNQAALDKLELTDVFNSRLTSNLSSGPNLKVDLYGSDTKNLHGTVKLNGLVYSEGDINYVLPGAMDIGIVRDELSDKLTIDSKLGSAEINGKIDFANIGNSMQHQLSQILPALVKAPSKKNSASNGKNNFTYDITTYETEDFLNAFTPGLKVQPETNISGKYQENTGEFTLNLKSDAIAYNGFQFKDITVDQIATNEKLNMDVSIAQFSNDTLTVDDLHFFSFGSRDTFQSSLTWNPNTPNFSEVNWLSTIIDDESFDIQIQPSHISIQGNRWDVKKNSLIAYRKEYISVEKFLFERSNQFISLDGKISESEADKLKIKFSHLQLDDFAPILQSPVDLQGELNGFGELWTPFTNIGYSGDASIKKLIINNEEVGDVYAQSQWEKGKQSIELNGDLVYKGEETFQFDGLYHLDRKEDVLDFNLVFDKTDIQFTNAFLDPQVVSDIKGTLDGKIKVTGTPDGPLLEGAVQLENAAAKIGVLGVSYAINGEIYCDEYGFYMDNIPVFDEEGNAGSMVGSIYHDNFVDWNFDLSFNLEDDAVNKDPLVPWKVIPLERFLVMNTEYTEGDYYYGKAYATGYANIFGYTDHLEITVDAQTKKGTLINFPMYGTSEIDDEESFIQFKPADSLIILNTPEIDFTGVDLNLNFDVTPDAKLKIIFDEKLGDEIVADGSGRISMKVDNLGDIKLDGTYTVNSGVYNFAMGPIKQNFFIEEGGYITWTGDPYNANLNLKSFYKVKASLSEITVDQLGSSASTNQDVYCYLDITESLLSPAIGFDIAVPRADESGKALINRITSDPEELNRQFFSLLLWKRFQPLKGSNTGGSGTALDLAANQINSMLSQLSKSYKLAVNLDADATGDKTYEVGVSKEFLDNRLIFTGSFGVENSAQTESNSSQNFLVGDMSLEYLLNEEGTFRVNIFNESNQSDVISDNNQGLFTQGAGLHYQEDFTGFKNFKLVQYFLDLFRKSDNKRFPIKRKKSETPVPKEDPKPISKAVIEEE